MTIIKKLRHLLHPLRREYVRLTARPPKPQWTFVGTTWDDSMGQVRGWDTESAADAFRGMFSDAADEANSGAITQGGLERHNVLVSFGYSACVASLGKQHIAMLDWGGAVGAYALYARSFLPDIEVEYHCKDVQEIAAVGSTLLPSDHFYSDDSCLNRQYDFVLASGSLQYSKDWRGVLRGLATAVQPGGYLFVTRLFEAPSTLYVAHQAAYGTEFLCWCIPADEFVPEVISHGLTLVREFHLDDRPAAVAGYEPGFRLKGYLFQR